MAHIIDDLSSISHIDTKPSLKSLAGGAVNSQGAILNTGAPSSLGINNFIANPSVSGNVNNNMNNIKLDSYGGSLSMVTSNNSQSKNSSQIPL